VTGDKVRERNGLAHPHQIDAAQHLVVRAHRLRDCVQPVIKAPADQFLLFEGEQNSQQGGAVKPGLLMQLVQAGGPKLIERAHHGDAAFDRANGLQPRPWILVGNLGQFLRQRRTGFAERKPRDMPQVPIRPVHSLALRGSDGGEPGEKSG